MPDAYEVVGDEMVVTHGRTKARLSLLIPMVDLARWWEVDDSDWSTAYPAYVAVMPDTARAYVEAVEATDGVRAVEIVQQWSQALTVRLGKALGRPGSGVITEPPSHPTSGSDTDS